MAVSTQDVVRWVEALQQVFVENREMLTALDSALGDGDCGVSMERGFTAAHAELSAQPPPDLRSAFQSVAAVLIRTMGGASGPLYGTFFLRAGAACAGKSELAAAGEAGMRATIAMEARKGRASYLGDRSVGHQDAGATASYLLLKAAAEMWRP